MMVRVLVLLALFGAPVSALAQPDVLSEKLTKEYQKEYEFYQRVNRYLQNIHPVREENSLRTRAMLNWYREDMETRLRWVERQDWTKEYKAMFARAVQWRKDSFNGGAEKLYRLSHKYLHAPNAEKYGYVGLSGNLLARAAMAGHAKAMSEFKDHPEQPFDPYFFTISRVHVYKDALQNNSSAKKELVVAYLSSPIFDDDLIKGYYWLLQIRELGVSERARKRMLKSLSFLPESERKKAEGWLSSGHIPPM